MDHGVYYDHHLLTIKQLVKSGSLVVDLGCGCGIPLTGKLIKNFRVLGVDISDVQLCRARSLMPDAFFVQADISNMELKDSSVHAVVALFTIVHLKLDAQQNLINRVWHWLKPGGVFMFTAGNSEWSGYRNAWHGVRMYWWQERVEVYLSWVLEAGFRVEELTLSSRGDNGHSLFVCRRTT